MKFGKKADLRVQRFAMLRPPGIGFGRRLGVRMHWDPDAPPVPPPQDLPQDPPASEPPKRTFEDGYSVGRAEAMKAVLADLGVGSLDDAKAKLSASAGDKEKSAPKTITEAPEYQQLATQYREISDRAAELERSLKNHQRLADEARVEKIKGLVRSVGGGNEQQVDQFARLFGGQIVLSDDGSKLEVLSKMPDGTMVKAGEDPKAYVEKIAKENPWFLAPVQPAGGGSGNPKPGNSTGGGGLISTLPLSQRLKSVRG